MLGAGRGIAAKRASWPHNTSTFDLPVAMPVTALESARRFGDASFAQQQTDSDAACTQCTNLRGQGRSDADRMEGLLCSSVRDGMQQRRYKEICVVTCVGSWDNEIGARCEASLRSFPWGCTCVPLQASVPPARSVRRMTRALPCKTWCTRETEAQRLAAIAFAVGQSRRRAAVAQSFALGPRPAGTCDI